MPSTNAVILLGNLGKDPETHGTEESPVLTFNLATTEYPKDQNGKEFTEVQWHRCVCFGKLAEIMKGMLKKGHLIQVMGKLKYSKYDDGGGVFLWKTEIIAKSIQICTPKGKG